MRCLLVLLFAAMPVLAEEVHTPPYTSRPNIVLIIVDTLRADRVAAERNGVPVMPNLRQFSKTGWNFSRTIAAASWTKPSVTSIFTSLYPSTHGLVRGTRLTLDADAANEQVAGLPSSKETMAAYLKRQGYATVGIQTNHLLGARDGFAQGFDRYLERLGASSQEVNNTLFESGQLLKEPFFLYLHYMEPHSPYNPPAVHRDAFGVLPALTEQDKASMAAAGSFSNYYMDKLRSDTGMEQSRRFPALSDSGREFFRTMYDGDCQYVDAQIRRAHDEIVKHWKNTLFIVTSDHGEELWEHGALGHGRSLEEELIRVPMLVFGAGISPRLVDDTWVEGIDLLPTIANLLKAPPSPNWQGRSLVPAPIPPRPVFSETRGMLVEANTDLVCVVDGRAKLIRDGKGVERVVESVGGKPLDDTLNAAILRKYLDEHLATIKKHPMAQIPPTSRGLDEEMLERLRALGYTAGEAK